MKCVPKIKEYREDRGIKQKWLAEQIDVSPGHLRLWEKGSSYPLAPKVLKLCKVLNCRIEDLYEEVEK